MDLRKIYQERGPEGLCETLQPYIDAIDELTKPAPTPTPAVEEVAEEEKE